MATPNQHKFITVEMMTPPANDVILVKMHSDVIAKSAADNEVFPDEFKAALDGFSMSSRSSLEQIQAWRDEATEIYFNLLEKSGKLKWKPAAFNGGSDYEEDNGTTPDIQINTK